MPVTHTGRAVRAQPECGFCKFMRAGPCGAPFTAWEACIEGCRDDEGDFVETCGPETLVLKECCDKHPVRP